MMTMAAHSNQQQQKQCSEAVEMKIIEALEKIGGTVESLVAQDNLASPGGSTSSQSEVEGGHSIHRYQITFSAPCEDTLPRFVYLENRELSVSPSLELQTQSNFMDYTDSMMALDPPRVEEMSEHDYDNYTLYELTDGELLELGAISPGDESSGVYPLSTEVLQQTIDDQLNKSVPPNALEWSSNLFSDLTSSDAGMETMLGTTFQVVDQADQQAESSESITSPLSLSPQQQSSEISSSSTLDSQSQPLSFVSVSDPNSQCNSATVLSQFVPQEYFTSANTSVSFQQVNFNISSTQQQILCPATLPSVSSLMTAGGNGGSSTTSTTVRTRQSMNGLLPTLLLPKTAASTVASSLTQNPTSPVPVKQRSRKTSPLSEDRISPKPNDKLPAQQNASPEQPSYTAWILQEGLFRSRQRHKLENDKEKKILYKCPVCGKSYGSANGIKYHAENGHGPKSTYTCEICNKEYASRHGLAAHRKNHEIRKAAEELEAERLRQIANKSKANI